MRKSNYILAAMLSCLLVFTGTTQLNAQADAVYSWANGYGSTATDINRSIATDASGNVYTVGYFAGSITAFGITNAGGNDIIITKHNAAGVLQWAKAIGGTSGDAGYGIALDASSNVYITGQFTGTVDFDPSASTANLAIASLGDIFVAKYDANGNYVWAKGIGGTGGDIGNGIAVDASSNVYITGNFTGTVDFDPSASATANLISTGGADIFMAKYDASGNYVWAKSMGSTIGDVGYSIAVDASSNVYITGYFNGTVDFDPSASTANLTSAGGIDIFMAKYNASGNYVWAKGLGGTGTDIGYGIAVDASSNVHITGYFNGTVDFDQSANTANLISAGVADIFMAKYDASGNYVWARNMGSTGNDIGNGIAVDASSNVYITGYFNGTADFDPSANTANLISAGVTDIFMAKYDASGNYVWAKGFGSSSGDVGNGIAVDASKKVYITGQFTLTVDFDPSAITANLVSNTSSTDLFIGKYSQSGLCTPTTGTFTVSACNSYTWVAKGNRVYTASNNTDTIHLTNAGGCDSLVTLNLTVNNSTTSTNSATACGSYLWNGVTYTTSGAKTKTFTGGNSIGCDSTATLNLTINNPTTSTTNTTISITALPYTWNGVSYNTNGTYTKTFTGGNSKGCDSVATLNLSIASEIVTNSQWTWVSGDNTTNNFGVYGTKGTAAASNKPGARISSVSWTDASGNVWLFGGNGYAASGSQNNLNDLWKYNTSTGQWTWVSGDSTINQLGVYGTKGTAAANNKPGARQQSITWTDASGNLWLFGGYGYAASGGVARLNDLWKYSISKGQWTWVSGDNTVDQLGVYGTKGTAAASNKPGARFGGSVSWTDASGNLWLFGGNGYAASGSAGSLNDLWKYNTSIGQWTWISGDNSIDQLSVYGTQGTAAASNKPGARQRSISWSDASGNLWLFGGSGYAASASQGNLNDLWKYNTSTGQWTWVSGDNTINQLGVYGSQGTAAASNKPGARQYSVSWTDASGNLWLFGGSGYAASGGVGSLNDLWKYNTSTGQWIWVSGDNTVNQLSVYGTKGTAAASNKPGARYRSVSWTDASGNLWLFGGLGYAASASDNLNDLWKITPICSGSTTTQTACDSYLWNGVTYTTSGTYTKTFTGAASCDSLATLNLTILSNYTITASVGSNGSISPSGAISVCSGNDQAYTITANFGYHIQDVLVDGVSNAAAIAAGSYTFSNITAAHTIAASFAINPPGKDWTIRTSAADNNWSSVTYGNGLFVAVAQSGTGNRVMTSPDGINWTSRTSASDNIWNSVTYGNGLFVAVAITGSNNRVMTSPDGINWTSRTSAANNAWNSVVYGNGLFVAVSYDVSGNRVMTSPDGINWTSHTSAADYQWLSVTYGNGLFVAVAQSGTGSRVMTSPDGINWTTRTSPINGWTSVSYANGVFVAVCTNGIGNGVMTSPNGINWTIRVPAADNAWFGVTYGNGLFAAVSTSGSGNRVMTSPDGISWTSRTSAADNQWRSVTYGNGMFVAVSLSGTGNRVMTSGVFVPCTASTSTTNISVCSSALPYIWNGVSYNAGGTYTKIFTNGNSKGCDSIATLNLTINTSTTSTSTQTQCGGTYNWNGITYTTSGTYTKTFTAGNSKGCDSTATLNLTINTATISTNNASVCSSYLWNGVTYNASGTYTKTFTAGNSKGCDSTATLNLTINSATTSTSNATACGSYVWNGVTYTTSGAKTKTFTAGNSVGCDSVATLNLTINQFTSSTTDSSVCSTDLPFNWNGITISGAGMFYTNLTNAAGCDSLTIINLTVKEPTSSFTNQQICFDALPYNWNGNIVYNWGITELHFTNAAGCDSTATLFLTELSHYFITPNPGLNGSVFVNTPSIVCINGNSGIYSIVPNVGYYILDVVVDGISVGPISHYQFINVTTNHTISASFALSCSPTTSTSTISNCGSYSWNGTTYTISGSYTIHLTNACGSDSAATLNLTINSATTSTNSATACGSYLWNGVTYTTSGAKTFSTTNSKGCDSTATLNLTINTATSSNTTINIPLSALPYTWNAVSYTASGTYTKTFIAGNSAGCDSVATLNLLVAPQVTANSLWTWMNGDNSINSFGVYGTKGVAAATNKPSSRYGGVTWTDAGGNLWLLGGYGYDGSGNYGILNDLWKYNITTGQWTWVNGDNSRDQLGVYGTKGTTAASNKPGGRGSCSGWADAAGNLWLFGGNGYASNGGGNMNDLWKYNISSGQWTWVSGDNTVNNLGVYGTKGATATSNKPGARYGSAAFTDASGNLWFFGGFGNASAGAGQLNDLWKYDISSGQWTWMNGDNTINHYGIYGTKGAASATNQPGSREAVNGWKDPSGNFWIFSGYGYAESGSTQVMNDLWKYNTSTGQWSWESGDKATLQYGVYGTKGTPAAANKPGARYTSATWADASGSLWLLGGYGYTTSGGAGDLNDLWRYNTATSQWTWVSGDNTINQSGVYGTKGTAASTNKPGGRDNSMGWKDANGNFWLFGGTAYTASGGAGRANDLWKLGTTCNGSSSVTTQTACGSYLWNGVTYNTSGTYSKTFANGNGTGCDSVATLNLTVKTTSTSTANVSICSSALPYSWNGLTFSSAGSQTAHLLNSTGCDSAATLNITIKNSYSIVATADSHGNVTNLGTSFICEGGNSNTYDIMAIQNGYYLLDVLIDGVSIGAVSSYTFTNVTSNHLIYVRFALSCIPTTSVTSVSNCGSYLWNGTTYTTSGSYIKHFTNACGGDSAATLNLTINNATASNNNVTYCNRYFWNGTIYTASGTYIYNTINAAGCDSTAVLNLTIINSTSSTTNLSICADMLPYSWNGLTFNETGSQTAHITNAAGCDSAATLDLTVNEPTSSTTTAITCVTLLPYNWNGTNYFSGGSYTIHLTNAAGCDSAATLDLSVNAMYSIFASAGGNGSISNSGGVGVCPGSNSNIYVITPDAGYYIADVLIDGISYGAISHYQFTNVTANHTISSIFALSCSPTTSTTSVSNCGTYVWNGVTYNTSGSYTIHLTNACGSDSAATLDLTINSATTSNNNVTYCNRYFWNGTIYTASGSYVYNTINAAGCDSTATLNLTINNATSSTTTLAVCMNALPYNWNGTDYLYPGTYTIHLTNAAGCDSAATLNFSIKQDHSIVINVGSNGSVNLQGMFVCTGGNSDNFIFTPNPGYKIANVLVDGISMGAISHYQFINVTTFHNIDVSFELACTATISTTTISACNNYLWNNTTYTSSGSYTIHLTNVCGSDSAATLNLTINQLTTSTTTIAACNSYLWNGLVYDKNGIFTKTFLGGNSKGCDSVATLNLTIKPNYTVIATTAANGTISNLGKSFICIGDNSLSYTITADAGYHIADVLIDGASIGVVSNYKFVNVTVNHTISATFSINCVATISSTTHTACGSYVWNGTTYTNSGNYTAHFTNSCGMDSAATLALTINQPTTSSSNASVCSNQLPYIWNGLIFTAAGTQTKTGLTNSKGCDSSATLTLSVATSSAPTVSVVSSDNNVCSAINVTFTATATNEGTAPIYQWKKNGVNVGNNSNTYSPPTLVNGDSVWCVLTSNSVCATTPTATSNKVRMIIKTSPLVSPVKNGAGTYLTNLTMCTIGGTYGLYNTYFGGIWSSSNPAVATAVNGALVTGTGMSSSGLLTALSSGTTTVTYTIASGNGCVASESLTILVDAMPTLSAITGGSSGVCMGNNITLSNSTIIPAGGSSVWSSLAGRATVNATTGVLTGVNAGIASIKYAITNANGCSNSTTSSITVNSIPSVPSINYAAGTINPQTGAGGAYCNNRTFTLVGSPTGGVWSTTNPSVVTVNSAGLTNTVGVGAGSIVYTIGLIGCSNSRTIVGNVVTCASRVVNNATNAVVKTDVDFTMYPNPAKTFIRLNVETLMGAGTIVITDLYGKQVKIQSLSMGTNTIDVSTFAKGVYLVSTITNEGKTTKKLVVE